MPLTTLITKKGEHVLLDAVDITRTVEDFGLPPADVAAVIRSVNGRGDVEREQITASQVGSDARQLYLQETVNYGREPQREMAALRGTMRHAVVNCEYPGLLVEQRVVSKDGKFSAKYDSFVPETGVLRDAKFVGYYKVLMVLKHGVEKEARDYQFQLNLCALILRQHGHKVNELWLDFEPQGVGKLEKDELLNKFGITDHTRILVPVPFLPEKTVWAEYQRLYDMKATALASGVVPQMCSSTATWGGKKCQAQPGGSWCPVAELCHAIAQERGEAHPRDKQKVVAA